MVTKWVLFMHDNALALRALATHNKLAYLGFHCLVHPPYFSGSDPVELTPVSWTEKTIESSLIFVEVEVITSTETGLDGQYCVLFCVACRSWSSGLRWVLSFVGSVLNKYQFGRCSCFLSVGLRTEQENLVQPYLLIKL